MYAVLGVPFDATSTFRPGSRFAPSAIREASKHCETYSFRTGLDLEELSVCDLGDLHIVNDANATLDRLVPVAREVVSAGKTLILIGGEHTITYGALRALGKDCALLCFDAHLDMLDECYGVKMSHGTFMRRLVESHGPEKMCVVGVRAASHEEVEYAESEGVKYVTADEIRQRGLDWTIQTIEDFLDEARSYHISVDMDVIDPSFAPAVGNPAPEGLSPSSLLDLALRVCDERLLSLDLTEACPVHAWEETTIQAFHVLSELICIADLGRRRKEPHPFT